MGRPTWIGAAILAVVCAAGGIWLVRTRTQTAEQQRQNAALIQERFRLQDAVRESQQAWNDQRAIYDRYMASVREIASRYAASSGDQSWLETDPTGLYPSTSIQMRVESVTHTEPPAFDLSTAAANCRRDQVALEIFDRAHVGIAQQLGYKPGEWK